MAAIASGVLDPSTPNLARIQVAVVVVIVVVVVVVVVVGVVVVMVVVVVVAVGYDGCSSGNVDACLQKIIDFVPKEQNTSVRCVVPPNLLGAAVGPTKHDLPIKMRVCCACVCVCMRVYTCVCAVFHAFAVDTRIYCWCAGVYCEQRRRSLADGMCCKAFCPQTLNPKT